MSKCTLNLFSAPLATNIAKSKAFHSEESKDDPKPRQMPSRTFLRNLKHFYISPTKNINLTTQTIKRLTANLKLATQTIKLLTASIILPIAK